MWFTDDYKIVVSSAQAYKQAGNCIAVDVLMAIVKEIINTIFFKNLLNFINKLHLSISLFEFS